MNSNYETLSVDSRQTRSGFHRRGKNLKYDQQDVDGFTCSHCHAFVSSASLLSGVVHRNHCPYCLWSRHLDLLSAGDRLSACKGNMQPVGLTMKITNKKYGQGRGELMLVHLCIDCAHFSINRIAADDDRELLVELFERSLPMLAKISARLDQEGIRVLGKGDAELVKLQLFGCEPVRA